MGVFETLLILDGVPIELEAHLDRLGASVRELFGAEPPGGVRELVRERARGIAAGRLRLTLAPGPGGGLAADIATATIDPASVFPSWERATALTPYVIPGGLGAHKWADRSGLAWTEAGETDGALPLVLDRCDEVLEASRANVFVVEHDTLLTPSADGRILPGVARARAIETARSLGIELREDELSVARLLAAGEAFLTGSVRGIEPVRSLGESQLAPPGDVVSELAGEMRRIWIGASAGAESIEAG
jgi:para-aminobenzoate synthetase/4-amino-4-deoxychorismate lyase